MSILSEKPIKFKIAGISSKTVISLTACKAATAAPTPYSAPTKLIPIVPPGAEPKIAIIGSTPRILLMIKATIIPVIKRLIVIINAGFQRIFNSPKVS